MSYSNQQIAKQIASLLKNKQTPIFQKGTTASTGINKELSVRLTNGKVVRALGWNVSTPGEVTVFWDAQNKRYVAWKEETNSLKRTTILANRKTRPDEKKYLWEYFIKVLQPSSIEGFDADVALDLTGNPLFVANMGGSDYNVALIAGNNETIVTTNGTYTIGGYPSVAGHLLERFVYSSFVDTNTVTTDVEIAVGFQQSVAGIYTVSPFYRRNTDNNKEEVEISETSDEYIFSANRKTQQNARFTAYGEPIQGLRSQYFERIVNPGIILNQGSEIFSLSTGENLFQGTLSLLGTPSFIPGTGYVEVYGNTDWEVLTTAGGFIRSKRSSTHSIPFSVENKEDNYSNESLTDVSKHRYLLLDDYYDVDVTRTTVETNTFSLNFNFTSQQDTDVVNVWIGLGSPTVGGGPSGRSEHYLQSISVTGGGTGNYESVSNRVVETSYVNPIIQDVSKSTSLSRDTYNKNVTYSQNSTLTTNNIVMGGFTISTFYYSESGTCVYNYDLNLLTTSTFNFSETATTIRNGVESIVFATTNFVLYTYGEYQETTTKVIGSAQTSTNVNTISANAFSVAFMNARLAPWYFLPYGAGYITHEIKDYTITETTEWIKTHPPISCVVEINGVSYEIKDEYDNYKKHFFLRCASTGIVDGVNIFNIIQYRMGLGNNNQWEQKRKLRKIIRLLTYTNSVLASSSTTYESHQTGFYDFTGSVDVVEFIDGKIYLYDGDIVSFGYNTSVDTSYLETRFPTTVTITVDQESKRELQIHTLNLRLNGGNGIGVYPKDDALVMLLYCLNDTATVNGYTITDEQGNETVELAISQTPTTTNPEKLYVDIYRFNTTNKTWERRPNAVTLVSPLTAVSDFVSYHPTPSNSRKKKKKPPRS
jgi:hypothetical protein